MLQKRGQLMRERAPGTAPQDSVFSVPFSLLEKAQPEIVHGVERRKSDVWQSHSGSYGWGGLDFNQVSISARCCSETLIDCISLSNLLSQVE